MLPPAQLPKIIFFDIDDTLYCSKEQRVAESTHRALQALKRRGILTAIATGRTPAVFPKEVVNLIEETGIDLLVSINGQYIRYRGETMMGFPLQSETVSRLSAALGKRGIAYSYVSDQRIALSNKDEIVQELLDFFKVPYQLMTEVYDEQPVYQMMAFYPPERTEEVAALLPPGIKSIRWHPHGVDLLDQAGSKARGIQMALAHIGLSMQDAMAFGDGLNDKEMMQAVGYAVVMDNGHDELKAMADYICPPVWDDGIARALVDLGILEAAECLA